MLVALFREVIKYLQGYSHDPTVHFDEGIDQIGQSTHDALWHNLQGEIRRIRVYMVRARASSTSSYCPI